jgi:hypothetical protein
MSQNTRNLLANHGLLFKLRESHRLNLLSLLVQVVVVNRNFKYMFWAYFLDYRGNVCAPLD